MYAPRLCVRADVCEPSQPIDPIPPDSNTNHPTTLHSTQLEAIKERIGEALAQAQGAA